MSPFEFLAFVQADLAPAFSFIVREGDLSRADPYRLTLGEKHVEFTLLGSNILMAFF